jgi:hypothetical protein
MPRIKHPVRNTLYPRLQDHDLVKNYPHVRGLAKDVFFFNHSHKEADESASKYNVFEVGSVSLCMLRSSPNFTQQLEMIRDLVLYLLRCVYNSLNLN